MSTPHRAFVTAIICAWLMLGAFALAGWSFYQGKRDICHGRDINLNVTRDILAFTRPSKAEFSVMPPSRKRRVIRFYAYADARIDRARC